jgi:hypothetical protein
MGLDRAVTFHDREMPSWESVRAFLDRHHYTVQTRMIDGQLAFPDEEPPANWRELRVSTPQGMVTVRREKERMVFVTWGNADTALREAWNALVWAFAAVGGGVVQAEEGPVDADAFRGRAELPALLRSTTDP